jgi:hypothetical protein
MKTLLGDVIDGEGIYGTLLHYTLIWAMVGSAFLIFIYLWRRGRLDMDEGPKYQMMQSNEPPSIGEHNEHKE